MRVEDSSFKHGVSWSKFLEAPQICAAAFGQAGCLDSFKHQVFDAQPLAVLAFSAFVPIFVYDVEVRLYPPNLGVGVQPARSGGNKRLFDIFDEGGEITAFRLLRLKMNHAAERLQHNGLLVKQAAEEVGFPDPFHFSRVFRKTFGVPPAQFRNVR